MNDPSGLLAFCIDGHLRNETLRDPKNWPRILPLLKRLYEEFPILVKVADKKYRWPSAIERLNFLEDLTETVEANPAKADSVEALLVEWSLMPSEMRHLGFFRDLGDGDRKADVAAEKILLRGTEVIPELLRLLDDRRITVHESREFRRSQTGVKRLGELAGDLLAKMVGGKSDRTVNAREPSSTQDWKDWWQANRDKIEKDILTNNVFVYSGEDVARINLVPVMILARRCPEQLQALSKEYLAHAGLVAQSFALAQAFADADLPLKQRVELLVAFLKKEDLSHNRPVLQNLARIDQRTCVEIIKPILEKLPKKLSNVITEPEAGYTHVVVLLDDDAAWKKYFEHARQCEVRMRLAIMSPMSYTYVKDMNRNRRLAFLAAFLDDAEVRDLGFGRIFAGPLSKIAVRDFAAMQIASIFKFEDDPDESWTADQWTKLREKVQLALKSQRLPDFSK